jgi:hypothetical protein
VTSSDPDRPALSTAVFDAFPFPAFVVDDDLRLLAANPAADRMVSGGAVTQIDRRGGEALQCINSAGGCGRSEACPGCVIRNAVTFAVADGQPVRRRALLEFSDDRGLRQMHALVTASPLAWEGRRAALLWFEDLALMLAMSDALPICTGCREVRDESLWLQIQGCLEAQPHAAAPLGLCERCAARLQESDAAAEAERGGAARCGPATSGPTAARRRR